MGKPNGFWIDKTSVFQRSAALYHVGVGSVSDDPRPARDVRGAILKGRSLLPFFNFIQRLFNVYSIPSS